MLALTERKRKIVEEDKSHSDNLLFDGSPLEAVKFKDLVYYWSPINLAEADPHGVWFEAILAYNDHQYPVWMRKIDKYRINDIVLIDELKAVYGVGKLGTHSVCCYNAPWPDENSETGWSINTGKTHFICFKMKVDIDAEGNYIFEDPVSAHTKDGVIEHNSADKQIVRKHLLFFELVGINYHGLKNFVWLNGHLFAINLSLAINPTNLKVPTLAVTYRFFDRVWYKQELLEQLLGFNKDSYEDFYDEFGKRMTKILEELCPARAASYVHYLKRRLDTRMLLYYQPGDRTSRELRIFKPDPDIDIMFI